MAIGVFTGITYGLVLEVKHEVRKHKATVEEINFLTKKYPYTYPIIVVGDIDSDDKQKLSTIKLYIIAYERGRARALVGSTTDDSAALNAAAKTFGSYSTIDSDEEAVISLYQSAFIEGHKNGLEEIKRKQSQLPSR